MFNTKEMKERILFDTSKMVVEQIGRAESYSKIEKVVTIVITDFILSDDTTAYHGNYNFYDKITNHCFSDKVEIHVLELPKLPGATDDTKLYPWMQFFQTKDKEVLKMLGKENKAINKAYNVLKEISADEKTRLRNEALEKARHDEISRLESAQEEGAYQEKIAMAKKLLATNAEITFISEVTELSIPDIEKLKGE